LIIKLLNYLLALDGAGEFINGERHLNLRVTTAIHNLSVLDCSDKYAESIMERSLGFINDVSRSTSQHDCAGFAFIAATELDEFVFTDHNFFDEFAFSEDFIGTFGAIKSGDDFSTSCSGESLNSIEISVLNDHDALVGEHLFGVVVDELSVDEDSRFEF